MPSRSDAFLQLESPSWHERLRGARALATAAEQGDLQHLLLLRSRENAQFVQRALDAVINRLRRDADATMEERIEDVPESVLRQIHSRAVHEVTRIILHEIESIAGAVSLSAAREVPDFKSSATAKHLLRLSGQLDAITQLKAASAPPRFEEILLFPWISEIVEQQPKNEGRIVSMIGPDNLVVMADKKLLGLAFVNGLRNALEACESAGCESQDSVIVSWNTTDIDCWISIKDSGAGLALSVSDDLTFLRSTKDGHAGMGLRIAQQAMESLDGIVSLRTSEHGGAIFTLQWFGHENTIG